MTGKIRLIQRIAATIAGLVLSAASAHAWTHGSGGALPAVYNPATNVACATTTAAFDVTPYSNNQTVSTNTIGTPWLVTPTGTLVTVSGGIKYGQSATTPGGILAGKTLCYSQDQEFVGYTIRGCAYLRYGAANTAFYMRTNLQAALGQLEIGIVTGLSPGTADSAGCAAGTYSSMASNNNLTGTVAGFTLADNGTYLWRFKVVGMALTLEWFNGTSYVSVLSASATDGTWLQMQNGAVAFVGSNNHYGFRNVAISLSATPTVFLSNWTSQNYFADFGEKDVQSTGSIAASSNTFTLDEDNNGRFLVGDAIAVETANVYGDSPLDVGGAWPAQSYANLAAANADTSKPNGTIAWLVAEGYNYRYNSSLGNWQVPQAGAANGSIDITSYYQLKRYPKPLRTTITAVGGSGNRTLTLATAASATVTGRTIYFDNASIYNIVGQNNWAALVPANIVWKLKSGRAPVCNPVVWVGARHGWWVEGSGSGIPFSSWMYPGYGGLTTLSYIRGCSNPSWGGVFDIGGFRHIKSDGNFTPTSFAPNWASITETTVTLPPVDAFVLSSGGGTATTPVCRNLWTVNTAQYSCNAGGTTTGTTVEALLDSSNVPHMMYEQWSPGLNNVISSTLLDHESYHTYMRSGPEMFRAYPNNTIKRAVLFDSIISSNSSGGGNHYYDIRATMYQTWMDTARKDGGSFGSPSMLLSPWWALNSNADGPGCTACKDGGEAKGIVVTYNSNYMLSNGVASDLQAKGIAICAACWNWTISDSIFDQMPGGSPSPSNDGAVGILNQGQNNTITNVRVIGGVTATGYKSIYCDSLGTASTISNSIADTFNYGACTNGGGNVTNATAGFDTTPNAFSFTTITGAVAGTLVHSNTVTITGVNTLLQPWLVTDNGDGQSAMRWFGSLGDTDAKRYRDGVDAPGRRYFPLKNNDAFELATIAPPSGQTKIVTFTLMGVTYTWTITSAFLAFGVGYRRRRSANDNEAVARRAA
jgi:hypothetical protein